MKNQKTNNEIEEKISEFWQKKPKSLKGNKEAMDYIDTFLRQALLSSERQRLKGEIEKMKQPIIFFDDQNRGHDYGRGFMWGFEKALSDILKLLE